MSERRESAGSVLDAALTATSSPIPTGEGGLTGLTASAIAAAQARCGAGGGALSGGGVGHTGMGGGGRALRGVVRAPSFGLKLRRGVGPGIRTAPSETVQGRASYSSVGRVDSPTLSAGAPCLPHHTEGDAGRPPGVLADEAVPPWLRSEPQPEDLPLTPDGRLGAARQAALPVTPDSPGQPASAKQGEPRAAARAGSLSSSKGAVAAAPDGPESLFKVSSAEMTEVLRTELPLDINSLEQSILGMDCEDSRFGKLLCSRLGYTQVSAGRWEGSEATGLSREVSLVVKCPPKPMLPDATRVLIRHRLQRRDGATLLLEREVATLDMPYGESFRVQERWVAVASGVAVAAGGADPSAAEMPPAVQLRVLTHVWFKGRVALVASKIRHHSTKKSRKVAALACELLMQADLEEAAAVAHGLFGARCGQPPPACEQVAVSAAAGGGGGGEWGDSVGPTDAALVELRERYDALFEEASYFKRRCAQLEMENARLEAAARHTRKDKTELADSVRGPPRAAPRLELWVQIGGCTVSRTQNQPHPPPHLPCKAPPSPAQSRIILILLYPPGLPSALTLRSASTPLRSTRSSLLANPSRRSSRSRPNLSKSGTSAPSWKKSSPQPTPQPFVRSSSRRRQPSRRC